MLEQLAQLLKTRKGKYILFLGAGASITSGSKTTREIVTDIVEKYKLDASDPWKSFCTFLKKKSENERFDILSKYFEDMEPSAGYRILAKLIEEGYFRLILTTNFDYMLEEALKETNLVLNKDYFVCIVGEGKERILTKEMEDESIIRIVKLHGDYKRKILPFTEEETFQFKEELEECQKRLTREGIVFVGYSGMDRDVLKCLSRTGGSVWWVNPRKVTADTVTAERNSDEYSLNEDIYEVLINRKSHENFIWGDQGKSDTFFENIYERISVRDINSFCDQFKFGATKYRKMKDLFEPPYQYEEMKGKLNEHRVLLILGEAHLGKTYTALNLLYDYYVEGFNVDFRSELYRREMQQEITYQWEDILKPNTVIYFEDPFGKTEPENVQIFKVELKRIIQRIQNSESMVIITSRLSIFKEVGDPNEFPMIVELMKQDKSYDIEKRKRIIDKYMAVHKPAWRNLLSEVVDGRVLKEWIAGELTEPHNIELLFEKSLNVIDVNLLCREVRESKEILKAFKDEIENINVAEKIFFYLCYLFEGEWEKPENLKHSYSNIIKAFDLDIYRWDFDWLLEKYDFRVETYEEFFGPKIRFSHPDFLKAVEESISQNTFIVEKLLNRLAKDENRGVRRGVAVAIYRNFEKLPENCRDILFELAKDQDRSVRKKVAEAIYNNYRKFPEKYRVVLFELAKDKDKDIRRGVAVIIYNDFQVLPEKYRDILFELAKDEDSEIREWVALIIYNDFHELPEKYKDILFELAKDQDRSVRKKVAEAIYNNYRKFPEKYRVVLFELAKDKDKDIREKTKVFIYNNIEYFSEKYRKSILRLARDEDRNIRKRVASAVHHNFETLPEEYRKLLFELAKDEDSEIREYVARTVYHNFETLPEEYSKLLFELAKDENNRVREHIAMTVYHNFKTLSEEYRKLLFELAKDENNWVREHVAGTVYHNFKTLSEKYRKLLFELAKDENNWVRKHVARTVHHNFETLPEKYRKLLFELAKDENNSVRKSVVETVGSNFQALPENYRRLLFNLSEDEAIEVKTAAALAVAQKFENFSPEYQGILKRFKSDFPVLDSLRDWIEENKADGWNEETIIILKRELDI